MCFNLQMYVRGVAVVETLIRQKLFFRFHLPKLQKQLLKNIRIQQRVDSLLLNDFLQK